jgi:hypothetical protein
MCHFDLALREMDVTGKWVVKEPSLEGQPTLTEYVASFVGL